MNSSEMRITLTHASDDPNADQEVCDLYDEIMKLTRRRLAKMKRRYRFIWFFGSRDGAKATTGLTDHAIQRQMETTK